MPIYNPLDPLNSLGAIVWYLVEQLYAFVYNGLNNPKEMLGTAGLAKWLFEENWGLTTYLAVNFVIIILGAVAIGWTRGAKYLPKAVIFAVILGMAGGTLFWKANQTILGWVQGASQDISGLDLGQAAAVQNNIVPFDKLEGPWQIVYAFDVFFGVIQALLLIIIVLSQFVVSWLFIATVSFYPLGETGQMIGRIGFTAWLISMVLAMPTMALLRRISVVVSHDQSEPWARITNYGFTLLMLFAFAVYVFVANVGLIRVSGGRLDSEVNGFVTADINKNDGAGGAGPGSSAGGADVAQPIVPPDSGTAVGLEDQVGYRAGDTSGGEGELVESPGSLTVDGLTIDTTSSGDTPDSPAGEAENGSELPSKESDEALVAGNEQFSHIGEWREVAEEVPEDEDADPDKV